MTDRVESFLNASVDLATRLSTSRDLLSRTLDIVTGFRQVCPPAVKLHVTSMMSAAQPRFGSIQYVPVREGKGDEPELRQVSGQESSGSSA